MPDATYYQSRHTGPEIDEGLDKLLDGTLDEAIESAGIAINAAQTAVQYSGKPPKPQNGTWWIWNPNTQKYVDSGIKSVLSIVKSYPSVAAMQADVKNMEEGDLVIIATANISDVDNSKLYVHNGTSWVFLSDLSGIQGVGIANIALTSGNHTAGTTDTYTITLTDGTTYSFTVYNGRNGDGFGDFLADGSIPMTGNLNMGTHKITNVAAPTQASDAARKSDVDSISLLSLGGSNPNLLDNWYFPYPINQRGKTQYTGKGYIIDRWMNTENSVTVALEKDGLKLDFDGTVSWDGIEQFMECADQYRGKTVTLSALVNGQQGKVFALRCRVYRSGAKYTSRFVGSGAWSLITMTFTVDQDNAVLSPIIASYETAEVKTLTVRAMKLELGTRQTLANQDANGNWVLNDPLPNRALELAKCQRCFQRLRTAFLSVHDAGISSGNSNVLISVPTPVPMRATPTVTVTGNFEPHWMSTCSITPKNGTVINCGNMVIFNAIASGIETSNSTDHITTVIIPDDEESYIDLSNDL